MSEPWRESGVRIADAVARASSRLSPSDPFAHVFYEERVDTVVRVSTDGREESVGRVSRGAAAVSRTTCHASNPSAADLERLATASGALDAPDVDGAGLGGAAEPVALSTAALRKWLGSAVGLVARSGLIAEATLVEGIQKVWVGREKGAVVTDHRIGRRIEVVVWAGPRGGAIRAVEDRPLGPDQPLPLDAVARAVERAMERAESAGASPPLGGWRTTPVVFAPGVAGIVVHELIGHALEADVVLAGRSRLGSGDSIALPDTLTVVDDPRRGRAPWTIDDEGTPSRPVTLIASGQVTGVLSDRPNAAAMGGSSSGHGRRSSYLERILPRMGCTYVQAGTSDPVAIVTSTEMGIYVRRLAAATADTRAGQATFVATDADIIVGGRTRPLLASIPIVVDVSESLGSIDAIGNDLVFDRCIGSCVRDGQPLATSVGAPTMRLGVVRAFLDPDSFQSSGVHA